MLGFWTLGGVVLVHGPVYAGFLDSRWSCAGIWTSIFWVLGSRWSCAGIWTSICWVFGL